jgi:hypothetical protein
LYHYRYATTISAGKRTFQILTCIRTGKGIKTELPSSIFPILCPAMHVYGSSRDVCSEVELA